MTEIMSLKDMPLDCKILLLKELGFCSDGTYVVDNNGEQVLDKYIGEPVKIDNMAILPGSTLILDDNPLSISSYLEEHGDGV
jgi:uncharacterized protein with ATP-grasp and redox domains